MSEIVSKMADELNLLRGKPYAINDYIKITQPTIGEIEEYGEIKYWSLVSNICSTSYDHRFHLDDNGIDYEDVDDFTIFGMIIPSLDLSETEILFGNKINFKDFKLMPSETDELILYNAKEKIKIDSVLYELIVRFLRDVHGLKRNYKIAGNKMARHYHMVEERKKWEESLLKSNNDSSMLAPLISALVNCADFKYNYENVWNLHLYPFMDAVARIPNTVNYRNLMLGIYTGNIDAKSIPQKELNWLGELKK